MVGREKRGIKLICATICYLHCYYASCMYWIL